MRCSAVIGLLMVSVLYAGHVAHAQTEPPSPETLVAQIRQQLAACDSQATEMAFVSSVSERELKDDGSVKSEKVSLSQNYIREKDARVMLLSMTEDGKPVSDKKLREEQKKIDQRRREHLEKQAKAKEKAKAGDDNEKSMSIMEPFLAEKAADYRFPSVVADSAAGLACWRITVEPTREDEDLVKGSAWVAHESLLPVVEEYQPAKMPTAVKEFAFRMEYEPYSERCAFPHHFTLEGKGRALLVIKFHFGVEMFLDSLRINPGLPDSLFASPANE